MASKFQVHVNILNSTSSLKTLAVLYVTCNILINIGWALQFFLTLNILQFTKEGMRGCHLHLFWIQALNLELSAIGQTDGPFWLSQQDEKSNRD